MRVKSVSFGYTRNIGNFQSSRADCTIELNTEDSTQDAYTLAEALVFEELKLPLENHHRDTLASWLRGD